MAERYTPQINEQGANAGFVRGNASGGNADVFGAGIWRALIGAGNQAERFGLSLRVLDNRQAELDATEALTDYDKRMNSWLNDPDTGAINNRKLSLANGVTKDLDTFANETVLDIHSRLSENARAIFDLREQKTRTGFINRASTFEATQMTANEKAVADAGLQAQMEVVISDPTNPEILRNAQDQGMLIIGQQMVGASEEAQNAAMAKWNSSLEFSAIQQVANEDVFAAAAMLQNATNLLPSDRSKLIESMRPEMERVETQEMSARLYGMFGNDIQKGSAYIRENYQGSEETRYLTGYRALVAESISAQNTAEQALADQQRAWMDEVYYPAVMRGEVTPEFIWENVDKGNMSARVGVSALDAVYRKADRDGITMTGRRQYGAAWDEMSQDDKDEFVMSKMATQGEREDALAYATNLVAGMPVGGTAPVTAELKGLYDAGLITGSELTQFQRSMGWQTKTSKKILDDEKKALRNDFNTLATASPLTGISAAVAAFDAGALELDPSATDYALQVRELRRSVLAQTLDDQNKRMTKWFGYSDTKIGAAWKSVQEVMDATPIQSYAPKYQFQNLNLDNPELPTPPQRYAAVAASGAYNNAAYNLDGPRITNLPATAQFIPANGPVMIPDNKPKMQNVRDAYGAHITAMAKKYGIPELENLIYAVIESESSGDINAVGPDKKVADRGIGLFQLTPGTAAALGVDPKDPKRNIEGGIKYLAQNIKAQNGNIEYALSAYQSGPGSVAKAVSGKKALGPNGKKYAVNVLGRAAQYTPMNSDLKAFADALIASGYNYYGGLTAANSKMLRPPTAVEALRFGNEEDF